MVDAKTNLHRRFLEKEIYLRYRLLLSVTYSVMSDLEYYSDLITLKNLYATTTILDLSQYLARKTTDLLLDAPPVLIFQERYLVMQAHV